MAQDIRELLKKDRSLPTEHIREGHQDRFLALLEKELPQEKKKNDYGWMKIAASVIVIISISFMGWKGFQNTATTSGSKLVVTEKPVKSTTTLEKQSPLANISPEYEKLENYYLTSIKFELSKMEKNEDNKELIDSFKVRLEKLNEEYQKLNAELMELGPNELSIDAMIENLQMRLNLLKNLKDKLKELEQLANEEYYQTQTT